MGPRGLPGDGLPGEKVLNVNPNAQVIKTFDYLRKISPLYREIRESPETEGRRESGATQEYLAHLDPR